MDKNSEVNHPPTHPVTEAPKYCKGKVECDVNEVALHSLPSCGNVNNEGCTRRDPQMSDETARGKGLPSPLAEANDHSKVSS